MSWSISKMHIGKLWGAPSSVLLGKMYIFWNSNVYVATRTGKSIIIRKEVWVRKKYVRGCSTKVSPTEVFVLDNRTAALYDVLKRTTIEVNLPPQIKVLSKII